MPAPLPFRDAGPGQRQVAHRHLVPWNDEQRLALAGLVGDYRAAAGIALDHEVALRPDRAVEILPPRDHHAVSGTGRRRRSRGLSVGLARPDLERARLDSRKAARKQQGGEDAAER
jgi:hypothetical protein